MRAVVAGEVAATPGSSVASLRRLYRVVEWFDGVVETSIGPGEVAATLELQRLVEPFHALVGERTPNGEPQEPHFRNREDELEVLRNHVEAFAAAPASSRKHGVR